MIDNYYRELERDLDNPIRLKILKRRLGYGQYLPDTSPSAKIFNTTELLIDIKYGFDSGSA